MPDWVQFRDGVAAGLPNVDLLRVLRTVEEWLPLGSASARAALEEQLKTTEPQLLSRGMVTLNVTLQREAGITAAPEAVGPALQQFFREVQDGSAPADHQAIAAKLPVLWELFAALVQKYPALNQPPSAADMAKVKLQQAATAVFQRMDAVANQLTPGTVTDSSLGVIQGVVRDARALIDSAGHDNAALPFVLSMTGGAERTLAKCCAIVGRHEEALKAFGDAADHFDKAAEPDEAEDCRHRRRNLSQQLSGRLDAAAEEPLATLSQDTSWERVQALMQLANVASSAADTFEALQNAEAAAKALVELGYADPGQSGTDAAMDTWIRAGYAGFRGTGLYGRVSQVGMLYDGILGARFAVLVRKDQKAADSVQAVQNEIHQMAAEMRKEEAIAVAEVHTAFQRYFPPPPGQAPEAPPQEGKDFTVVLDRMSAVDKAVIGIQQTCNARADAGEPMDDLLAKVGELEAEADQLNSPVHEAKTRLERAYVLLKLGRGAELGPVAREARHRLLAGRPAGLASFAQSYERYLYLDSLNKEAMGCVMTGDFEGSLKICQDTVRDFETQRYGVNSEYRQSALLSWVADFYTWAAFSAFKLGRWDDMLEVIDLIKARSAIRSRLMPDDPQKLNVALRQEFEQVNARLEREPDNEALRTRRRQLWDLQSIERAQDATTGEIPALTVASLQNALDEDEVLVGYFWLAESVILTISIDHERFHAERIILKPVELGKLREFVAFVQGLKSSHNMDNFVAQLGAVLMPPFLRDFIGTRRRIIISPHHSLHLFPFHAARWGEDGGFVGTEFAVRYVPNFVSVLLPWSGAGANRVLAIAIRDFANSVARPLDKVEEDARAIAACYREHGGDVEMILGEEATRERIEAMRLEGALKKFRCIHLGTHGLSVFETPDQPLESWLLLQDGALDAMDIAGLGLNAELAVLSACHSGQRAIQLRDLGEVPGDDIFGLQSALFRSGVRSIVGTLWLVETESASPITRAFHRYHAEGNAAEVALRLAVREYLANPPDGLTGVYYWAPYFISSIGKLCRN
jgi:hypothetical protein